MKHIILSLLLSMMSYSVFALPTQCNKEATEQAKKLLAFHFGSDERIEIDPKIKELTPIRNPVNKKQQFAVLELWGYIYKGRYRMHLIYYRLPDSCLLMGQEVLEYASP